MSFRDVVKQSLIVDRIRSNAMTSSVATIAVGAAMGWGVLANAESARILLGHIPSAMTRMKDEGKIDDGQNLSVTIALHLQHEEELNQRIAEIYNPNSPFYHQFLSSADFNARYAPSEAQVARERARLESQGVHVQSVSDNRMLLKASASVSSLNQAFATELHQYRKANDEAYFAPAREPQVAADSMIKSVVGLNNLTHFHNHLKVNHALSRAGGTPPVTPPGSAPGGGLAPADIRTAYGITADGSGQTLALFELDGYAASDVTAYENQFGIPNITLQNVLVDGSTGAAGDGADEVTLDIELMTAIARNASKIIVYEGPNSSQGMIDTYSKIASDNIAKQVSTSWGQAEDQSAASDIQAENQIFTQMVAQGQALYAAAGDSGADDDGSTVGADDPSAQPNVIAVGGTTLTLDSNSKYISETTWNELSNGHGAGGGGISTVWKIPAWQQGAATADSQASSTMRNTPDVSFNADPMSGYAIYVGGQWEVVGGTSAAAPIWAAFTALINQQRAATGLAGIGFTNPSLYAIGKGADYHSGFHDISDNSSNGFYNAVAGYDNATGWGTFQGQELIDLLSRR